MLRRDRVHQDGKAARIALAVFAVLVIAFTGYVALRDPEPPSGRTSSYVPPSAEPTTTSSSSEPATSRLAVDFSTAPDGEPRGADFELAVSKAGGRAATPVVSNGVLTVLADGPAAGYAQVDPDWTPRRIGAEFRFGAGNDSGAVCLAFWDRLIPDPFAVPDSGMHFIVSPTIWELGVWQGSRFESIGSGLLSTPLQQDGSTTYATEVTVSGSTATITLPDGSREVVKDSRIASIPAEVLNWENYLGEPGGARSGFTRIWAS